MAYSYGYMAEFTDMATGALRILLLTTGVGGGYKCYTLVCALVFWVTAFTLMLIYMAVCLTCSGSICVCVWWITSVISTVIYSK